jgi:hypothetical protein
VATKKQTDAERRRERAKKASQTLASAPLTHARDLVPLFSGADPKAPTAGAVRMAFRAHLLWMNDAGFAVVRWQNLPSIVGDDVDLIKLGLCELYSRALFESAFAAHFDGADPRSDVAVLAQMRDVYGAAMAAEVHSRVAQRGPVRDLSKPSAPLDTRTPEDRCARCAHVRSAHDTPSTGPCCNSQTGPDEWCACQTFLESAAR